MKQKKYEKRNEIDMLHGPLLSKIILFALPLAATSLLQSLLNSADVAVLGHFAGSLAQAAVGCTSSSITLIINLFVGISVGANAAISMYIGQGNRRKVAQAVQSAILLAIISGFLMLVVGEFVTVPMMRVIQTPKNIFPMAVLYMRIYFLGMPCMMLYNFGSAILRSKGDTRRPLYALILSGFVNVGLNVFFVVKLDMGVAGVATATVISQILSAGMVLFFLKKEEGEFRVEFRNLRLVKEPVLRMLRIGIPAGLQGVVFSISNVCIQSGVNSFGPDVIAGSSVATYFEFFSFFLINAFSQAAVTFISQNYGAGQLKRCNQILVRCLTFGMLTPLAVNLILVLLRDPLAHIYTSEEQVVVYAAYRMSHILIVHFLCGTYEISGSALRGFGYSLTPTIVTIAGTCVFRLAWVFGVFPHFQTFGNLLLVYPVSWIITGMVMIATYCVIYRRLKQKAAASAA